jgi:glycosyltransferase involved in cell wall biosynthesis
MPVRDSGAKARAETEVTEPGIVFLSRKWPPAVGGMETYALRLAEALEPLTRLTRIVLPGRANGQPPGPLALIAFGLGSFLALARHHRDADVIHIGDMASWPLALAVRRPAVVLAAHGTDVAYPLRRTLRGRLYGAYLRLGARLLPRALVIANSGATEAAARSHGFIRSTVIPLATDFTAEDATPDLNRLLFSGRLTPRKGLAWFVRQVLPRLPETVHLDVAGTIWDADEAAALDHPRVHHLGHVDQAQMARAFAGSLAVVVPNIPVPTREFEGFGLVAVEAAASGGVVLASDDGGLVEAVRDGETGLTLPAADAEAWVAAITRVLSWSSEERHAFTARATKSARRHYSWDRVARDTLAAYQDLIRERQR